MGIKQQLIKDFEIAIKQLSCNLAKEIEKSKKFSVENRVLRNQPAEISEFSIHLFIYSNQQNDFMQY